jgi:hypothetical protein
MVQRMQILTGLRRAFSYNEQKLKRGQAELISAENFIKFPHQLDIKERLTRFNNQMALNDRAKKRAIQITLNFHPSENGKLDKNTFREIAREYMKRMGFENQPYLVYQHHDAGHPHVHIVSTLINADGARMQVPRPWEAKKYIKELEQIYGLLSHEKTQLQKMQQEMPEQKIRQVQKLKYGQMATMPGISNVLDLVITHYKYTSLLELNAILRLYNVQVSNGREGSKLHNNKGLIYQILDDHGKRISKPIPAHKFDSKPTLRNLERKFLENEISRQPDVRRLKIAIDWTLVRPPKTLRAFVKALEMEGVEAVVAKDKEGRACGFAFVDHRTRSAFGEGSLGQKYTSLGILERLGIIQSNEKHMELNNVQTDPSIQEPRFSEEGILKEKEVEHKKYLENIVSLSLETLLKPEGTHEECKNELTQENARKKEMEQSREL